MCVSWTHLHIKGKSVITGNCQYSVQWAKKGAHTLIGKHLLLSLFHYCACVPTQTRLFHHTWDQMRTGPHAVKRPYKIKLLNSFSSQMELSHMKQGGLERSKAHFLDESWGDWITMYLNMDERWGKSRGLPGEILWEKEEAGESWKRLCECITGWEMNNTWKWTVYTMTSINTCTHRATHPRLPSSGVCINIFDETVLSADKTSTTVFIST